MGSYGNLGTITQAADVAFVPKVWSSHIEAYFRRKMALGQLALIDNTLKSAPGETVNFPYFKAIGDAEEPGESDALTVDKLADDAFSVTVKEVGKALGWKDKALRSSAASKLDQHAEAQRQIARVFAEKTDKDIITCINTAGAYGDGFVAVANTDLCTVKSVLEGKVLGFGDLHDQTVAIAMHSLCFLDMMKDGGTGFLQANSLDPFWGAPGFQGRLLGMALFTLDSMPRVADINGKKAYASFKFKANPFGIYMAEDMNPEMDRDILYRETIVSATMWYGVLALHGKVSAEDKRITRSVYATSQNV